jgi:hypothetical protein
VSTHVQAQRRAAPIPDPGDGKLPVGVGAAEFTRIIVLTLPPATVDGARRSAPVCRQASGAGGYRSAKPFTGWMQLANWPVDDGSGRAYSIGLMVP